MLFKIRHGLLLIPGRYLVSFDDIGFLGKNSKGRVGIGIGLKGVDLIEVSNFFEEPDLFVIVAIGS